MYHQDLIRILSSKSETWGQSSDKNTKEFLLRLAANFAEIHKLFYATYGHRLDADQTFDSLLDCINSAFTKRPTMLLNLDAKKISDRPWFLSNEIAGMSLYVDRFCGTISDLTNKLDYFQELGVNLLHLMPLMKSPEGESDGGYAVSDFRTVEERFGTIEDLHILDEKMKERGMYLMLDMVLNHTSHHHEWAQKASAGDKKYQDFFYMYDNRDIPNTFDHFMPDIFPESSPGNFTFDEKSGKWVMTVFNSYQWDLNFSNPDVFVAMLDNIFFYANLGVDILRIDAPAFIWKKIGTNCQNLPQAHTLLQLIKLCVQVASPGMALLGEAIVAPKEIMKYFGVDRFKGLECDVAYGATHMALQWDALATGDTRVMVAAQEDLLQKPYGTTWITYTRCHDDIGLGYEDEVIVKAGYNAFEHRTFLKNYYSGNYEGSTAKGALFGVNPKTNDARISGSLASLCGLEFALEQKSIEQVDNAIDKILMMQAHSMLLGGIPMLFYGDECGYINDNSYLKDEGKSYDNRWMHRPKMDWKKNEKRKKKGSIEFKIFEGTKKILSLRKTHNTFSDYANIYWLHPHNHHVAGYIRYVEEEKMICLFNFSNEETSLTWYSLIEKGINTGTKLVDLWSDVAFIVGEDNEFLALSAYQFVILHQVP